MKKIVLFLLLICFSFGQFSAMERNAAKPPPKDDLLWWGTKTSAKAIGRTMWFNRQAIASGFALTGAGIFAGLGIGPMIAVGGSYAAVSGMQNLYRWFKGESSPWISRPGTYAAGAAGGAFLLKSLAFWLYYKYTLSHQQRTAYDEQDVTQNLNDSLQGRVPVNTFNSYATPLGATLGLASVCILFSLLDTLSPMKKKQYEDEAKKILKSIETYAKNERNKYFPEMAWQFISANNKAEVILIVLNSFPMLAWAMQGKKKSEETMAVERSNSLPNQSLKTLNERINLPKNILEHINQSIYEARYKPALLKAWFAVKNAMLYQVQPTMPDGPTVFQQVFFSNDNILLDLMLNGFNKDALAELLLLNQDLHCRTLMHGVAGKNNDQLTGQLQQLFTKKARMDQPAITNFLKPYFKLENRSYDRTTKNEDGTETTIRIKKEASLIVDDQGQNPLHKAAFNLNNVFVELFFQDPELLKMAMLQQDNEGRNPLHLFIMAVSQFNGVPEKDMTEEQIAKIQTVIMTMLQALATLSKDTISTLLTTKDNKGMTPLHHAAQAKSYALIQHMLNYFSKAKAEKRGWFGHEPKISDLLKVQDAQGNTPLHYAVDPYIRYLRKYTMADLDVKLAENRDTDADTLKAELTKAEEKLAKFGKAILSKNVNDYGFELKDQSAEQIEQAKRASETVRYLREAVKLAKIKATLQSHGIDGFFEPKTVQADAESIKKTIKALFPAKSKSMEEIQEKSSQDLYNMSQQELFNILSIKNNYGQTVLHKLGALSTNQGFLPSVQVLLYPLTQDHAANLLSIRDANGLPVMHSWAMACKDKNAVTSAFKHILTELTKVIVPSKVQGETPTLIHELTPAAKKLLNMTDASGQTLVTTMLLNGASYHGALQEGLALLTEDERLGFTIQQDKNGNNFLHRAVLDGTEAVKGLQVPGDILNKARKQQNKAGDTPLHIAIKSNDMKLIESVTHAMNNEQIKKIIQLKKKWTTWGRQPVEPKDLGVPADSEINQWLDDVFDDSYDDNQPLSISRSTVKDENVTPKEVAALRINPTPPQTAEHIASLKAAEEKIAALNTSAAAAAEAVPTTTSTAAPAEQKPEVEIVDSKNIPLPNPALRSPEQQTEAAKAAIEEILAKNPQTYLTHINSASHKNTPTTDDLLIQYSKKKLATKPSIKLRMKKGAYNQINVTYDKAKLVEMLKEMIKPESKKNK